MAGTITETHDDSRTGKCAILAWTSDAAGAVSGTATTRKVSGVILRVTTIPADGPTDNYDVVLNDEDGIDVLQGFGADRDTTNAETITPLVSTTLSGNPVAMGTPVAVNSTLTLVIANAGNAKSGTVRVYYR